MIKSKVFTDSMKVFCIVAFFMFVLRLWPLVLLAIAAAICSLAYVIYKDAQIQFMQAECTTEQVIFDPSQLIHSMLDREDREDFERFGRIQQRISTQLESDYPTAIWRWESSTPFKMMQLGHTLRIILKRAGGVPKAKVALDKNGEFVELKYYKPIKSLTIADDNRVSGVRDEPTGQVDYALIAMHWMDNNRSFLVKNEKECATLVPAEMLPEPPSWEAIKNEMECCGYGTFTVKEGINYWIK